MSGFIALLLFGLQWQPPTLPPVSLDDLRMFPPHRDALLGTQAGLSYREYHSSIPIPSVFYSQQECDNWHTWYRVMGTDSHWRWDVWDDLRIATDLNNSNSYRLLTLRNLRCKITPANYYQGIMPPPVPPGWR